MGRVGSSSLKPFFHPKAVAIIGASDIHNKIGTVVYENFLHNGFAGKIFAVNPKYSQLFGHPCYPTVKDIPSEVDLAVVLVPAAIVPKIMGECIEKGVKTVVIISGGFKEIGPEGADRERILTEMSKKSGVRIIGPNCIGIFDGTSKVDTFFFTPEKMGRPKPGSITFMTQSGAFGAAILDWASYAGMGMSKCISYGNMSDVDDSDLLEYLAGDSSTKVIAAYIEGIDEGEGHDFMRAAAKASATKPVILIKAGKTMRGAAAAKSHTGSLAGTYKIYEAAMKQSGIIEANDFEDMFDMAKALSSQPPLKNNRVLVLTNGGGCGVMAVDACEKSGLIVQELSPTIQEELKKVFPSHCITHNPIDVTGDTDIGRYKVALEKAFLENDEIDGAVVNVLLQAPLLSTDIVDVLDDICSRSKKPIVLCCIGGEYTAKVVNQLEKRGIPTYPIPERAVKAMGALKSYGDWLKKKEK